MRSYLKKNQRREERNQGQTKLRKKYLFITVYNPIYIFFNIFFQTFNQISRPRNTFNKEKRIQARNNKISKSNNSKYDRTVQVSAQRNNVNRSHLFKSNDRSFSVKRNIQNNTTNRSIVIDSPTQSKVAEKPILIRKTFENGKINKPEIKSRNDNSHTSNIRITVGGSKDKNKFSREPVRSNRNERPQINRLFSNQDNERRVITSSSPPKKTTSYSSSKSMSLSERFGQRRN